jgi:glutamate synthase domain-containing protein 1
MRPASTRSNAIPRESRWEKRNDVDRKFIFWKQKYMRRTTKTRNLERIQKNKELGIYSCRKLQKSSEKLDAIYQQLDNQRSLFLTCLRYACGEAQRKLNGMNGTKIRSTASSTDGRVCQSSIRCKMPRNCAPYMPPCILQMRGSRRQCPFW